MGNPELVYFACFGRGGVARLMFKLAGIEFTDTQIPLSEDPTAWAAIKDGNFINYYKNIIHSLITRLLLYMISSMIQVVVFVQIVF